MHLYDNSVWAGREGRPRNTPATLTHTEGFQAEVRWNRYTVDGNMHMHTTEEAKDKRKGKERKRERERERMCERERTNERAM